MSQSCPIRQPGDVPGNMPGNGPGNQPDTPPGSRAGQHDLPRNFAPAPVAIAPCSGYARATVSRAVGELFAATGYVPAHGERVLVKPNLLRADATGLTCTAPEIVRAACAYLLDHGAVPSIADSPGFGTAAGIARSVGIDAALADLSSAYGMPPLAVSGLGSPVRVPLSMGGSVAVSRHALEADSILNLPRLKAHTIMRVTCAVKNLYGCICGTRKALMHATHGGKGRQFPSLILDILAALPPVTSLVDAITAMHGNGPSGGKPYNAGLLFASRSPVALDTLVYAMIGLTPPEVPLWEEARVRNIPGSCREELTILGTVPGTDGDSLALRAFTTPAQLMDQSFSPPRLLKSAVKRIWSGVMG